MNHSKYVVSLPYPYAAGSLAWRRSRGLLTISDHVLRYAAIRVPRGAYKIPLPADYREALN